MKKLIIVSCILMIASFAFSQNNTKKIQGPAAKNAKPWHKKSEKNKVFFIKNKEFLKGPAAKNAKPWHNKDTSQVYVEVKSTNRYNLKGPKAKNFKPWMLPIFNKVDTIAIKERGSSKIKRATE